MKHTLYPLGLAALMTLTACGTNAATPSPAESTAPAESVPPIESTAPIHLGLPTWMPEGTALLAPETEPLPLLADVIAETYMIPEEERASTRYTYNYVDLNGDGEDEIFTLVLGPYTSGTGGDSGLLVLPYAGMTVSQRFTLLRGPILVSDHTTDGVSDLVCLRGGGGAEPSLITLTAVDGVYGNPSDAPTLDSADGLTGTAILTGDMMLQPEAFLTLEG